MTFSMFCLQRPTFLGGVRDLGGVGPLEGTLRTFALYTATVSCIIAPRFTRLLPALCESRGGSSRLRHSGAALLATGAQVPRDRLLYFSNAGGTLTKSSHGARARAPSRRYLVAET